MVGEQVEQRSSFEVDRNAKGDYSFKVKCYKGETETRDTDEELADRVFEMVGRFDAQYPVKVKDGTDTDK